jgi:hypothetical protein
VHDVLPGHVAVPLVLADSVKSSTHGRQDQPDGVFKGATQPFATILRWMIADNENLDKDSRPISVPLLVVTKLAPGPACHVAYVDVRANAEPNRLARQAADEKARAFDCADKPLVIGERGRAIELARP